MVDSHVLVGSCAQIGARVHLAAGVTIGGVLEPPGARPVIVEDDAFVGAGQRPARGRARRARRGHRRGVTLTGTSRAVRPRPRDRPARDGRRAAGRAARCRRDPRARGPSPARFAARPRAGRVRRAAGQGPRRRDGCPGRARRRPPVSLEIDASPAPGTAAGTQRDPAGRAGSAGIAPDELATRFGTPLYVYDLDVVERQVTALTGVLPPVVDLAYAVKANPALAVVQHLGRLGPRCRRRVRRGARPGRPGRDRGRTGS